MKKLLEVKNLCKDLTPGFFCRGSRGDGGGHGAVRLRKVHTFI